MKFDDKIPSTSEIVKNFLMSVTLLDFLSFSIHRFSHMKKFHFHKMHHEIREFFPIVGFYFHPIDFIIQIIQSQIGNS